MRYRLWLRKQGKWIIIASVLGLLTYVAYNQRTHRGGTAPLDGNKHAELKRKRYANRNNFKTGPGENGQAVILSRAEQSRADGLFKKEAFNIIASDKVAMDRSIPDVRDPQCKRLTYPSDLPTASVIIIFHNEAWSPLLRTVHSVVNRSPPEYLHEVILLDDLSYRDGLGKELEDYVTKTWPDGVVKIIRTKERSGLIRARLTGAKVATGDVVIFLDSHCEANEGWLEPILARIKEKPSAVVCPEIDVISAHSMAYAGVGAHSVGGFWWSLHFSWRPIPPREKARRQSNVAPIRSPTMAGGLFAADRKYFFAIGSYDEGMEVWGGENLEISFRTWMCGGTLEFIPCSRVGHIFRASHPYTFPGKKDTHGINSIRLAEVWMDEYKRLFYMHRKDLRTKDYGDVSQRKALRKRLKCKSFRWYLDNVYPEKFIPDENVKAWGMVKNPGTNTCLDTMGKDEKIIFSVGLFHCQGGASANQIYSLSNKSELRREESCFSSYGKEGGKITFTQCNGGKEQQWKHAKNDKTIIHTKSGKCLDKAGVKSGGHVVLSTCNGADSQKWDFQHYTS